MGKYILGILCFFISASAVAQFIPQSIGGAPNSLSSVQGAITGKKGVVIQAFPDTTTVNLDPSIKKTNGLIIKVGDTLYFRNQAISKWISLGVNNSVNVVYHGVDSVTTPSLGQICVWTGGLPNCFTVTTPVVPSGNVDSVTVINNQLCYYTAGVPTCYTVSSSIVNNTYITQLIDSSIAINNYYNGIDPCLPTILQGSIIWVSGFNFSNTKYVYRIGCQLDSAEAGNFSITESDTLDRYTIIWADTLGNLGTTDGTTGLVASIPTVDPDSQILLATYFVPAYSTQPQNVGGGTIANDTVYISNNEWVGASTIIGANFAYATNPFSPTVSTRIPSISAIASQYIEYTDGESHLVGEYSFLSFYLRLGATFANNTRLNISFYNAGSPITQAPINLASGTFGYDRTIVGAYQLIVIPISSWAFTSGSFNKVRISTSGSNASGFQLDNIILQRGGNNSPISQVVKSYNGQADHVTSYHIINADTTYYVHIVNGVRTDSVRISRTIARAGTNMTIDRVGDTAVFNATGGGGITDTTSLSNRIDNAYNDMFGVTGGARFTKPNGGTDTLMVASLGKIDSLRRLPGSVIVQAQKDGVWTDQYTDSTGGGGSGSGVDALAPIGAVPNGNGASISGTTLTLQPADSTYGGVTTTGTQFFKGVKKFVNDVHINNSSNLYMNVTSGTNRSFSFYNPGLVDNLAVMLAYPSSGTNVGMSLTMSPRGHGYVDVGGDTIRGQLAVLNTDLIADPVNYNAGVFKANGDRILLSSSRAGAGVLKPLVLSAGAASQTPININQLVLNTDGSVTTETSFTTPILTATTSTRTPILALSGGGGTNRDLKIITGNLGVDNLSQSFVTPFSGTNVGVDFSMVPTGTGLSSTFQAQIGIYNTDVKADGSNFEVSKFKAAGPDGFGIYTFKGGTGTQRPFWIDATGGLGPSTANITFKTNGLVNIKNANDYADNAAAISAGLVAGDVYRTGDLLKIVH